MIKNNITKLDALALDVVHWNLTAQNNLEELTHEKMLAQIGYVLSEAKETVKAWLENDHVEVLDGVADVFVTLTYLYRLARHKKGYGLGAFSFVDEYTEYTLGEVFENSEDAKKVYTDGIASCMTNIITYMRFMEFANVDLFEGALEEAMSSLIEAMVYAELAYKVDIADVIVAVCTSNWSKYQLQTNTDPAGIKIECKRIEETQGYKNVSPVFCNNFVIYRDNFGKGKIRKPSTYQKPNVAACMPV